jgi:hypothetical protein
VASTAVVLPAPRTSTGLILDATVERDGRVAVRGRWRAGVITDVSGGDLVAAVAADLAAAAPG